MIRQFLQPCNHQSPSWPRPEGPSCGGRRGPRTVCITIPRHIHATLVGYRRLSGAHYVFLCIPTYTPKLGRAKQSAPKSPSPHHRAGASALSRPHWARQRAKPKLGEAARQAQASSSARQRAKPSLGEAARQALTVPLHPDLHARPGARQAGSAQVSKPTAPRGLGLEPKFYIDADQ